MRPNCAASRLHALLDAAAWETLPYWTVARARAPLRWQLVLGYVRTVKGEEANHATTSLLVYDMHGRRKGWLLQLYYSCMAIVATKY